MSSSTEKWPNGPYILDYNYASQLEAIRGLLFRNQRADVELADEIAGAEDRARQSRGPASDFAVDYAIDLMERSIYQDVAHSMAAVGMIAPFMEGVFRDGCDRIEKEVPHGDLVKNVLKIVEETGLTPYLPDRLALTMEALFRYRNDLFHWGFEWPAHVCQDFKNATNHWPDNWFDKATRDDDIWLFSMSPAFIDHCVDVAEEVAAGLEDFLLDKGRQENGFPPLGRRKGKRFTDLD